jgi:hypothetical protein
MALPINEPGFLTRIVNRIREATQEVMQGEVEPASDEESAAAAREQKRRDDAIRRREFNHLREVRALRMKDNPELSIRLSVFQNSSTFSVGGRSIRGRAKTVKKIDAIEAELAQQWWSNNSTEAQETRTPDESLTPKDSTPEAPLESEMDLDFTGENYAPQAQYVPTLPMQDALGAALDLFGQGQHDNAEAALVALLQSPQLDDKTAEACSAALLNLYRTTGARANFDTVAIEYAQLFGRSAPEWRHTHIGEEDDVTPEQAGITKPHLMWECPSVIGSIDMVALQALAKTANVTEFDWSAMESVDAEAAQALLNTFTQWAQHSAVLHFKGATALQKALAALTPVGDNTTDALWWRLRLEGLRVLNAQEAFDDAAMDYCVTYEISPPAWIAPHCQLASAQE